MLANSVPDSACSGMSNPETWHLLAAEPHTALLLCTTPDCDHKLTQTLPLVVTMYRTVNLLPCKTFDVDDPALPVNLHDLAVPPLHRTS